MLAVFKKNPFPDKPPQYIRMRRFIYNFTEAHEQNWWKRSYDATILHKTQLKRYADTSELGLSYKRVDVKEYMLWSFAEQWVEITALIFMTLVARKFAIA